MVNSKPAVLNEKIRAEFGLVSSEQIVWRSPLVEDRYAEYRDESFLERMELAPQSLLLKEFWPKRGPQWDALGKTQDGKVFLVEAKAHIKEMISPPTGAAGVSLKKIQMALEETRNFVNPKSDADWSRFFYQFTNRMAHLYFLRVKNGIPAYLIFIYFVNDEAMSGPKTKAEWQAALTVMHSLLQTKKSKLDEHTAHVFVEVSELSDRNA